MTTPLIPAEVIKKKRDGRTLSDAEISSFISAYTEGQIPDYQMSALLMAIFLRGMETSETLALTNSMLHSGVVIDFSDIPVVKVDKHSTGGVGDKTSLILGPIVAACGLAVPMISGRGLGHTGGTLDKLESIPGFNTQLSIEQFKAAIRTHGIAFIGQTKDICPADKKIYALRDVTATVESLPLICASIMSKKLAEGIDALVLDVKFGSGAFMKKPADAEALARGLMSIARGGGKKVSAFLTNMDQPLGRYAGNSLEVEECVEILQGRRDPRHDDTRELSLKLAAKMLELGGAARDFASALELATQTLENGKAYEKFVGLCRLHGGNLAQLPKPKNKLEIKSDRAGFIRAMNTEAIGVAGIKIRAGRAMTTDLIEPTAGIEFHAKIAAKVNRGDILFTLYGADRVLLEAAAPELLLTLEWGDDASSAPALIWKELE